MTRRAALTVCLLAVGACSQRPRAPALSTEAVFQDEAAGLRFLAPAGWVMQSRAILPAGQLTRPAILVAYQRVGGEKPAEFRVLAADLPGEADLERFLTDYRVGSESWTPQSPAQPVTVNGVAASRYVLSRTQGKDEVRREVTAFRRGGRVYFFLVAFAATDAASRDAVRTAVASVTWMK